MKQSLSFKLFCLVLCGGIMMHLLWLYPVNQVEAQGSEDLPVIERITILPDADMGTPGTQILPQPAITQDVTCDITTTGDPDLIDAVSVRLFYPDGSLKCQLSAEVVSSSEYRAVGQIDCDEPAGHYRTEAWITRESGEESPHALNSFEYRGMTGHTIDFSGLEFAESAPGEHASVTGDDAMSTPAHPTIFNQGNTPLLLTLDAIPMVGATSGQEIVTFDSDFLGQHISFVAGESVTFATALLPRSAATPIDFGITIPSGLLPGSYTGAMTISSVAPPSPQMSLSNPGGGEIWHTGEIHPIHWIASDPEGHPVQVSIWFSPDAGASWTHQIAENIANSGMYNWTIPRDRMFLSDEAQIRVIAVNQLGMYKSDLSGICSIERTPMEFTAAEMTADLVGSGEFDYASVVLSGDALSISVQGTSLDIEVAADLLFILGGESATVSGTVAILEYTLELNGNIEIRQEPMYRVFSGEALLACPSAGPETVQLQIEVKFGQGAPQVELQRPGGGTSDLDTLVDDLLREVFIEVVDYLDSIVPFTETIDTIATEGGNLLVELL